MDFKTSLAQLAHRTNQVKEHILTEEATKTSIIMPFFQILGYDVFNPREFLPEFTCDVADRKKEKIDYAIMRDGKPVIIIEAKPYDNCLEKHAPQLIRYFSASEVKFAVLTNGILYKFFTDLEKANIMDDMPFFEFDLTDFRDEDLQQLKKFRKENFDISSITDTAEELKYRNLIIDLFNRQLEAVDDDFIGYVISQVWPGRKRTNFILTKFRPWVQRAFTDMIEQTMEDRLLPILKPSTETTETQAPPPIAEHDAHVARAMLSDKSESKIITTQEEIEAYFIVKNILSIEVDVKDISHKDTSSYFAVLYKNNTTKWICRLYLSDNRKLLVFPTDDRKGKKIYIKNIDEIANYKEKILKSVKRYL